MHGFVENCSRVSKTCISSCLDSPIQDGTDKDDIWRAVAMGEDGSVILAGYTCGNWVTTQVGECDVAVVKLDLNGTLLWTWQVTVATVGSNMYP